MAPAAFAFAATGPPAARGCLARAGWNVLSGTSLPGLPAAAEGAEAEGKRLVAEVAASWSRKYTFTIRQNGLHDGLFHYECLFSRPTDERPVPSIVIAVQFALLPALAGQAPRLLYSIEDGDLRHEWALVRDAAGRWHAAAGQQPGSLRAGSFEAYLDAYVHEKETVRSRGVHLTTSFEASRLTPPPAFTYDEVEASKRGGESASHPQGGEEAAAAEERRVPRRAAEGPAPEVAQMMQDALTAANMYCDKVPLPSSLRELLANIFDAADEESLGAMPHHEVARVLMATLPGFGLEEWDIHHLLTSAHESEEGFIECQPFIQAAPDLIRALRERRAVHRSRELPDVDIPAEAMKQCFGDEVALTVDGLMQAFENCAHEGPGRGLFFNPHQGHARGTLSGTRRPAAEESGAEAHQFSPTAAAQGSEAEDRVLVALKRRFCRECIESLGERISPQEAQMLMQMLPEDEDGFVHIDELSEHLERLRMQALLNAVVECNARLLRTHLVLRFRDLGLTETCRLKVWVIRHALLQADQVCLSRLQIHTLLCLSNPDHKGDVDIAEFLGFCSALIPHMSNARIFVETAARVEAEQAEAAKERQNAELAALGAARVHKVAERDEEPAEKKIDADQETVERTLIQVFSLSDDTRKPVPALPPQTIFNLLYNSADQQVQGCGLSELEVAGLLAEMPLDGSGEVAYHDFVKRWVPILFEVRRNLLLSAYLKENAAENLGIPEPDYRELEALYPVLDASIRARAGERRESKRMERKPSKTSAAVARRSTSLQRAGTLDSGMVTPKEESYGSPLKVRGSLLVKAKEPPPGRGFHRRKLQWEELKKRQLPSPTAAVQ